MASIEERLNREEWNPMPGDQVIGTITGMTARQSKKGDLYPILTIKDDDGIEHIVSCAMVAGDVIAHAPDFGERVGVKFVGQQPKSDGSGDTWDKWTIAFEREDTAAVDWEAMARSRGLTSKNTSNGAASADTGSAADPWDATPDIPWADEEPGQSS